MAKEQGELTEENSIAIGRTGILRVEKPVGKVGFLYMEARGQDVGRIVFDRRKKPLKLMFNQTAFSLDHCTKRQKKFAQDIRKRICQELGAIDATKDQ